MTVLEYATVVFITQLIFIGTRTWNVRAISDRNLFQVLLSGAFVHISWLVSVAIGAVSMHEIIANFNFEYIPVVIGSLTGGLIGSWIGLMEKDKK